MNLIYESVDAALSYKIKSNQRKVFLEFIKMKFYEF